MDDTEVREYQIALGKIVIEFNNLEHQMAKAIAEMISPDGELTNRITGGESFLNLQRLLNALFRFRISSQEQLDMFNVLNKKLTDVDIDRNNRIHGNWLIVKFLDSLIVVKNRQSKTNMKHFKDELSIPTIEELEYTARSATTTAQELINLMNTNRVAIHEHIKSRSLLHQ